MAKSDRPRRGVERLKRWVLSTGNSNLIPRAAIIVACCVAYFLVSMAAVRWIPGYFGISETAAILEWLLFPVFVFGVWVALNTLYHSERGRLSVLASAVLVLAAVTFLYLPPFVWLVGSNPCGWPPAADSCPMTTWEDVAREAAQMLAWQAADTVPALSVTETLDWVPLTAQTIAGTSLRSCLFVG